MASALVPTEKKSQQVLKFINLLAFPFLTGFLLDLPWPSQMLISIGFVLASLIAGDFVDALLNLWQAIAVAGFLFLIFDYASGMPLNQEVCALSIPCVWAILLAIKRRFLSSEETALKSNSYAASISVASLALLQFIVPRGQIQSLGFLGKGEDSALYLWASIGSIRGGEFRLATAFGASSYLYFFNFLNNASLSLSLLFRNTENNLNLLAITSLSNAWIFVLLSSIIFSIRIFSVLKQKFETNKSDVFLYAVIAIQSFLFFRGSQDVGHFTQYLMNCAVLVFMLTLVSTSTEIRKLRRTYLIILSCATALSLVGSYGPWLPLSLIGVALSLNLIFEKTILRSVLASKFWFVAILGFVFSWIVLMKKLNESADFEMGGGVAVIPLESVWLVVFLTLALLVFLILFKMRKTNSSDNQDIYVSRQKLLLVGCVISILSLGVISKTSFNQLTTLSFVVIIGLCFQRSAIRELKETFTILLKSKEFDGIFILAFSTFLYALGIYGLSRFIGPIYEPMYAANKSMFAAFGQFSWLLIPLIAGVFSNSKRFLNRVERFSIISALFLVLGLTSFMRYDEVQKQWWHKPAIAALNKDPNALIVCVNPILTRDYEAYKCNHFMNTLANYGRVSFIFEGISLGDSQYLKGATDYFSKSDSIQTAKYTDDIKVVVLSKDQLSVEATNIFEVVPRPMIQFRTGDQ